MPNLEQTESITTTDENLNAAFKMFSDAYSKGAVNTIKEHPVESVVTSTAIGAAIAGAAVLFLTRGRGLLPMAEREAGAMLQTGMNTGERLAVGATRSYAGAALREAPERALVNDVAHPELLKAQREASKFGAGGDQVTVRPKTKPFNENDYQPIPRDKLTPHMLRELKELLDGH